MSCKVCNHENGSSITLKILFYFRDILSVSKKLATEREEMVNELQSLKQMVDTLHNNMQSDDSRYDNM